MASSRSGFPGSLRQFVQQQPEHVRPAAKHAQYLEGWESLSCERKTTGGRGRRGQLEAAARAAEARLVRGARRLGRRGRRVRREARQRLELDRRDALLRPRARVRRPLPRVRRGLADARDRAADAVLVEEQRHGRAGGLGALGRHGARGDVLGHELLDLAPHGAVPPVLHRVVRAPAEHRRDVRPPRAELGVLADDDACAGSRGGARASGPGAGTRATRGPRPRSTATC